jgi:hypothetical protein
MAMLGNGSRLTFGTGRAIGGLYSATSGGIRNKGEWSAWRFQDKATTFKAGAAYPTGYNGQSAFYNPMVAGEISMRLEGDSTFAANLYPTRAMSIDMTGSGDLSATAGLVIAMLCAMTGSGTLTAAIEGRLNMSADFTGSGDLDASISGIASMLCDMTGTGDLEATIAAYGNMAIDIVVTGTGLTTANVGQAVWSALAASNNDPDTMGEKLNDAGSAANPWTEVIESGYTAEDVLRILFAVAAGKTTITDLGGGNATVAFRDQADTKNRILADMTGSERTDITLDPS